MLTVWLHNIYEISKIWVYGHDILSLSDWLDGSESPSQTVCTYSIEYWSITHADMKTDDSACRR